MHAIDACAYFAASMSPPKKLTIAKAGKSEALVLTVLERIATILLRLGFDAPNAENLLRSAFVLAALRRAEVAGIRFTQSQIALVAGVNRLDVRKTISARQGPHLAKEIARQSRVERILGGWRQDSRFVDSRGRPKPLTIAGRTSEFSSLVRAYGRDVTTRTLRDTLVQDKHAVIKGNRIVLADQAVSSNAAIEAGVSDLNFLRTQLASINLQSGRRSFISRQLNLNAKDAKSLKLLQRKAVGKIETALGSLESVVLRNPNSQSRRSSNKYRLLVSTILTSEMDSGRREKS